jgi:TolB-like protein/DNA-binding SARP family transcriptional activator
MERIELRLLGAMQILAQGQPVLLSGSRKARLLLAMLALEPRLHSRTVLCEQLWPDTADPRAELRSSLTRLRHALGADAIVSSADAVGLDSDHVHTDVVELTQLLDDPESAPTERLVAFEARFSDAPLAGLDVRGSPALELWLQAQRESMNRLHQRLLGVLVERTQDRPEEALSFARRRVGLDPMNGAANEDLLRHTLLALGRREAQATLERIRQRFREEGLPDDELIGAWRRLIPPGASRSARAPDDLPGLTVPEPLRPPGRPSVAVLGFEHAGASATGDVLAEGLSVDLTHRLARLKGLFVIARGSARQFSLHDHTPREVGSRLGVRYLVHGTTQRAANRIRVTAELTECENGVQIWSERIERPFDDLFLVQDQVADAIVAVLEPQIERAEQHRARILPTAHLDAWECYHRAMWHSFRFTRADTQEAHRLLERALTQDPHFARAHAALSFNHFSRAFLDATRDFQEALDLSLDHARESVSLEPRDAFGHWALSRALFLAGDHDPALAAIDRALIANPNYAQGHYARGFVGTHAGLPGRAAADLHVAQRLSPFDPLLFAMMSSGAISLALRGRHAEAADLALRATLEPNAHFHIHAVAAACLELAGRRREAADAIRAASRAHPGYSIAVFERSFPQKMERDRSLMRRALQAAGLPET